MRTHPKMPRLIRFLGGYALYSTKEKMTVIKDNIMVQSLPVALQCEEALYPGLKEFFDSLCIGSKQPHLEPLNMVVRVQSSPPQLPANASPVVEMAVTKCYRDGQHHYFTAQDGSMVRFEAEGPCCQGFIRPEILNDMSTICSLVSGPLIEIMKSAGRFYLHAAALAYNGVGYLISGDGGCGKTTSALNLVRSGFDYVSDDSLLVDNINGVLRVYPWYRDFHVSHDICRRYDELSQLGTDDLAAGEKLSVDVSQYFKGKPISWIEPDVILFPRICSRKTSVLSPLGPMEMFTRLLKQIILGSDPGIAERQLEMIKLLVQKTQGFELISGEDLMDNPDRLSSLIANLSPETVR